MKPAVEQTTVWVRIRERDLYVYRESGILPAEAVTALARAMDAELAARRSGQMRMERL